jgi:signal transduction histidine kinase
MDSKKILIVDDDAITALSLEKLTASMGHVCVGRCGSAEAALTIAGNERPDIALLDVNIEGEVDGVDTGEILFSRFGVHVLFITAYSDEATLLRAKNSHPFGYILKPYSDQNVIVALTIAIYQIDLERTLRDKDEFLKVALAATKIGIWRYSPNQKKLYCDESAASILGIAPGDHYMTDNAFPFVVHKDDQAYFIDEYRRAYREKSQFEIDMRIIQNVSETRWVRNKGICSIRTGDEDIYFTGSIVDITDRKFLEDKFLNIYEANRQEMGQQIHDELGQQLTGLTLLAESLVSSLEEQALSEEAARAKKIALRAYGALEDARRIARNLYPVQITPQGFEDAIISLASDAEAMGGIPCGVENRAGPIHFNNAQATQIYYIIREAINNAIKHSHATAIRIKMYRREESLHITVADNGIGIPPEPLRKGLGMNIMEFRAGMSKGTLMVGKGENSGSEITISVRDSTTSSVTEEDRTREAMV